MSSQNNATVFFQGKPIQTEELMTPKQKIQAKKEAAIRQREEELKQAAHGAKANYEYAKF